MLSGCAALDGAPSGRLRQQLLFAFLDRRQVRADDALRIALGALLPVVQPDRLVAEPLDQVSEWVTSRIVLPRRRNSANLSRHLCVKPSSPTASTSSTSSTSGSTWIATANPRPHVHAGRVGLHRRVDELAQLREVDDLVEAILDLALREPEHDAVDEDVLAAGDLRMKSGAELDQRGDAAVDLHACPHVGLVMPATSFSAVLLPDPLRPMTPKVDPCGTMNDTSFSAGNVSLGCRSRRMLRCSSALFSVANCLPP